MMNNTYSIIIPFFDHWDLTHKRLFELYKFIPQEVEIVLVDDCSTEEVEIKGGVGWWQKNRPNIKYIRNKENLGFGGSHNRGAKVASGNILVFLSNDVEVSGDFIKTLDGRIFDNLLIGNRIIDWKAGWNEVNGYVIPYLEGYFLACSKQVWVELGGFDLRYGKYDYEDVDLSMRTLELKYSLVSLETQMLRHLGGRTIYALKADRLEQTKKNREIFIDKWQDKLSSVFGGQ